MGWLVTGGAGYIGAHVVLALRDAGLAPVVVDDLSSGVAERVPPDVPLIQEDVRDAGALRRVVRRYRPDGVVHLAARKDVAESTAQPLHYYRENLEGLRSVLGTVIDAGLRYLLFSSSAAVYGTPAQCPVAEGAPTRPENVYGRTKLVGEWMLRDAAHGARFAHVALRYFNVAGAGSPELGDIGQTNLVPRLLSAAATGTPAAVYGTDYPTPDGSPVRDYIHVADIADAHLRAVTGLLGGQVHDEVFNVGRGRGASVLEMIAAVRAATGHDLGYRECPRRLGDPASVVASAQLIEERLGWRARYDLTDIVSSAWAAYQARTGAELIPAGLIPAGMDPADPDRTGLVAAGMDPAGPGQAGLIPAGTPG